MAQDTQDPQFRIRIRFFRSEGLDKWQVFQIAAALPLLLQVALLLFFIGLSEYLRQLNPVVGWATTGTILAWLAVFIFTTLAPILSSQCPYRTPILKQPLQYLRSAIQRVYGFIKRYVIGSICLSIGHLLVLGKRIYLSQILPPHKRINKRRTSFITRAEKWLDSLFDWVVGNGDLSSPSFWLRLFSACPILLPWLLLDLITLLYRTTKLTLRQKWMDTSSWEFRPLPEESTVRGAETNDWDILIYSGPFFLDQQLNQTIRECIKPISVLQIVSDFAIDRPTPGTSSGWRVDLGSDTGRGIHDMVREILLHTAVFEPRDPTWFTTLQFILEAGKYGPYWSQLPALIIQLTRSDLEHGAIAAFLALYSSLAQGGGSLSDLCKLFEESRSQGDQQCTW